MRATGDGGRDPVRVGIRHALLGASESAPARRAPARTRVVGRGGSFRCHCAANEGYLRAASFGLAGRMSTLTSSGASHRCSACGSADDPGSRSSPGGSSSISIETRCRCRSWRANGNRGSIPGGGHRRPRSACHAGGAWRPSEDPDSWLKNPEGNHEGRWRPHRDSNCTEPANHNPATTHAKAEFARESEAADRQERLDRP